MRESNTKVIGGNQRIRTTLWEKLTEILDSTSQTEELKIESIPDPLDQVISNTERELAVVRLQGYARLIQDIRSALLKIKEGAYGRCEECDEPIAAKRLDALPWARYCVRCQQQAESRPPEEDEIGAETAALLRAHSTPPIDPRSAGKERGSSLHP